MKRPGFRDPLTGLVQPRGVRRRARAAARRNSSGSPRGDRFAVLYLDLDRFKVVNDSLGHLVGDELLIGGVAAARDLPAARAMRWRGSAATSSPCS